MKKLFNHTFLLLIFFFSATYVGAQQNFWPEDFPEIQVNVFDDPEPGHIFISPCGLFGYFMGATPFLAILDNYGTPVFYREMNNPIFDFKLISGGVLSYHNGLSNPKHIVLDSSYSELDSISISGQGITDFHDFRVLDNGNYLLLGTDYQIVDMDTVVPGGQQGATVVGYFVQEQTPAGEVLFYWSTFDHFKITETDTSHIDLVNSLFIDYAHTNAIDQDTDTSILLSSRNMHEITKINKITGEIIWRMGGSQNEFEFIGDDTLGFSAQHDIRRLDDGNYMLFDNGWYNPDGFSSALILELDEANRTATVVDRFRSQPEDILGWIMGSCQRLPGGNTLVGWGSGVPNLTEFKPDGTKSLEMEFESTNYRAYKFPWHTNIFSLNNYILDFGLVNSQAASSKTLTITNNNDSIIEVFAVHSHGDKFSMDLSSPVLINSGASTDVVVEFTPADTGSFEDVLTIYARFENETENTGFARQLFVYGVASEDASLQEHHELDIVLYPNPGNGKVKLKVKHSNEDISYAVTDIYGNQIFQGNIPAGLTEEVVDLSALAGGIYLIQLQGNESGKTSFLKYIKQ